MTGGGDPTPYVPCNNGTGYGINSESSIPVSYGPLLGLPLGCFGPFPSTPQFNIGSNQILRPNLLNTLGKKKRNFKSGGLSTNLISMMPATSNTNPLVVIEVDSNEAEHTEKETDITDNEEAETTITVDDINGVEAEITSVPITPNTNPLTTIEVNSNGEGHTEKETVTIDNDEAEATIVVNDIIESEAELTAKIGKCVGFDTEADNPILLEVLGESGENTGPQ
ncbi:hypothetical protein LXL04_016671 [Taraxacum kok-saghyz]